MIKCIGTVTTVLPTNFVRNDLEKCIGQLPLLPNLDIHFLIYYK